MGKCENVIRRRMALIADGFGDFLGDTATDCVSVSDYGYVYLVLIVIKLNQEMGWNAS